MQHRRTKRCVLGLAAVGLVIGSAPKVGAEFGSTITWSTVAAAPVGRTEAQGITVDGKLYLLGGFQGSPFGPTDSAHAYDAATNTWATLASMPMRLSHAGVAAVNRDIYVAGGYFGSSSTNFGAQTFATTAVWKYNIDTNVWSAMPSLPAARGSGALTARGRFLHFYGGADISRNDKGEHWILNLDSGGWVAAAAMPNPRSHMGYAEIAGKVCAIGGQHDVDANLVTQNTVNCYNPATNTWATLAPIPVARGHISSATFSMGGRILVFGGETSHGTSVNLVNAYDPLTDAWSSLTNLPANRYSGVAGPVGGTIYYTTGNGSSTTYRGIAVGYTGLPDIDASPARVVVNDVQGGAASAPQTITLMNPGEGPLTVSALAITGAAASVWQISSAPSLPATVPAGGSTTVSVVFNPTVAGPQGATLEITSNDADEPVLGVPLRGLGTLGLGGTSEPSLQWILDTWQIPVDVGDPDPTNNSLPTTPLLGEEVIAQTFRKGTGSGGVTLEPLGVFGPQGGSGIVTRVGWYLAGNASSKQELFTVPNASYQTLVPTTTGTLAFDPATSVFGVYSIWPFFSNREVFSEDALNTFSGAVPHHVRVYRLKDAGGAIIPQAYVVATEEHISGFDYQDVVYVMRNARPSEGSCSTAADCPSNAPECNQYACVTGECQLVTAPSGTPCTSDGNACTVDVCNAGGSCVHTPGNAGAVCRPSAGLCDLEESCTGSSPNCPADGFVAALTVCRVKAGDCDVEEACSGVGPSCPADGFIAGGTVCRTASGDCDAAESCSGISAACPADAPAPAGSPCGSPSATSCTSPDTCDGAGSCVPNHALNGSPCGDQGVECRNDDACQGGVCQDAGFVAAGSACSSDGNVCTDDVCDGAGSCAHVFDVSNDPSCATVTTTLPGEECIETVDVVVQTKSTSIKLSPKPESDKVKTGGSFVLPEGTLFMPNLSAVKVTLRDSAGAYYEATIPEGRFVGSASGKSYKFKDNLMVHNGMRQAKLSVGSDGRTVRYKFGAQRRDLPDFVTGIGGVTIQIGTDCFSDTEDVCTTAGASVKCK
jgi:N-acetylneuraminic acid mutarotase